MKIQAHVDHCERCGSGTLRRGATIIARFGYPCELCQPEERRTGSRVR